MTDEQASFLRYFNEAVEHHTALVFCARHSSLQEQACTEIDGLLNGVAVRKANAVKENDERFANVLLGCERLLEAIQAELRMWILLKSEQPDRAWSQLVSAQSALSDAMKADEGFAHLEVHLGRLASVERTVFPPQTFLSAGMVVDWEECCICKKDYKDCSHIKGRPYLGQLCSVPLHVSEANHIAIVEEPANKNCRVITFTTAQGHRNKMTWLVEPYENGEGAPTQGLTARSTIAVLGTSNESIVISGLKQS